MPLPRASPRARSPTSQAFIGLMRMPAEAVDYFAQPTHYLTDHVRADLAGSGIEVPPFGSYAHRLVEFMREHPDVSSAAMV